MKIQQFIKILDHSRIDAALFFRQNGKDIFKNDHLLKELLKLR